MPEYLHPGVYIEEIERGPKPDRGRADQHGGVPRRDRARPDEAAARHQLQGLPALVRRRLRRHEVHAVRRERLLRERRQAPLRLPRSRMMRPLPPKQRSAPSSCAPSGPGALGQARVREGRGQHYAQARPRQHDGCRWASGCASRTTRRRRRGNPADWFNDPTQAAVPELQPRRSTISTPTSARRTTGTSGSDDSSALIELIAHRARRRTLPDKQFCAARRRMARTASRSTSPTSRGS